MSAAHLIQAKKVKLVLVLFPHCHTNGESAHMRFWSYVLKKNQWKSQVKLVFLKKNKGKSQVKLFFLKKNKWKTEVLYIPHNSSEQCLTWRSAALRADIWITNIPRKYYNILRDQGFPCAFPIPCTLLLTISIFLCQPVQNVSSWLKRKINPVF